MEVSNYYKVFANEWCKIAAEKKNVFFLATFALIAGFFVSVLLSALVEQCFCSRLLDLKNIYLYDFFVNPTNCHRGKNTQIVCIGSYFFFTDIVQVNKKIRKMGGKCGSLAESATSRHELLTYLSEIIYAVM